jgi:hypothetical protein
VRATCLADGLHVTLFRGSRSIRAGDRLVAATIGGPTHSGSLASSDPVAGIGPIGAARVVREVVEDWVRRRGASVRTLDAAGRIEFSDASACSVPEEGTAFARFLLPSSYLMKSISR